MKRLLKTLILIALLGGLGFLGYNAVINRQININHFVIGGMTRGVDLSSYQGEVDFAKLKEQKIEFAYIKATEGSKHTDAHFVANWAKAETAGVLAGAYHFFSYESSGAAQAENFIAAMGDSLEGRLIPAIDLELSKEQKTNPPEKADVVVALKTMLTILEEKYRVKPLIYATKEYYEKYLAEDFGDYPRWVRSVLWPVYLEAGDDWLLWQYDDHGELAGYNGSEKYIDLNVVNSAKGLDALKYK